MSFLRKHWSLVATLALLYAAAAVSLAVSIGRNGGHVVYALDDPYIMMATAKNLAQHGVWGITRYGFTSSSSSILWPLLLALTYVGFGVNELSPLVLNMIAAGLLVGCLYFWLRRYAANGFFVLAALASIICFAPLPALILTGHEHIMHAIFSVCLMYFAARSLAEPRTGPRSMIALSAFAALTTASRYEGIFLVSVIACLFLAQRRLRDALQVGAAAALPIVIFGLVSVSHGWHFLPESILAKGRIPDASSTEAVFGSLGSSALPRMVRHPFLITLFLGNLAFLAVRAVATRTIWRDSTILAILFVVAQVLHLQLAGVGSLHRYEAYLVVMGLFAIAVSLAVYAAEIGRPTRAVRSVAKYAFAVLVAGAIIATLLPRARELARRAPLATTNIYEQQYQMGLFVKRFYQGQCVALNDIGAVNFLADIRCLDLWGLANLEVAEAKKTRTYDTARMREMAKAADARIAILYPKWFRRFGGLPPEWAEAGQWRIRNNVICGASAVSLLAVDPSETKALASNLGSFSPQLPRTVLESR
jgi:hypothetical protein